ncbi:MAG: dipeptidyl-peptidase 3 family protein, partial [Thermomonas sp.]
MPRFHPVPRRSLIALSLAAALTASLAGCKPAAPPATVAPAAPSAPVVLSYAEQHAGDYVMVPLKADLSAFDAQEQGMIALLVEASEVMNDIFWLQSYGEKEPLLAKIQDPATHALAEANFGPWDRLNNDTPFVDGVGPRPAGSTFYPQSMSKEEFEAANLPDKTSWYTLLRQDKDGKLITVPYHIAYQGELEKAANLLRRAAPLSHDKRFGDYLRMRADALLSDKFQPSDLAWMDMKTNPVDIVIGPIETYEDQLFGYKAAYEGLVLVKDIAWSEKLARFAAFLPALQKGLPVEARYKAEVPGSDADLNAYEAVYYAGNANVGAKTIAINLPNDE